MSAVAPLSSPTLADRLRSALLTPSQLDSVPPPTWLIERALVADSLAVLYGKPGVGKSFVALDWALSVATGHPWLNHPVAQGDVLYVAAEGAGGMSARKRAWEKDRGVSARDGIHFLPESVNLLRPEWADALVEVVDELQPILIVLDTLARSIAGGDENGPRDMGTFIENVERLRSCTRATVLAVHHTPKDGGSLRGHSSLHGALQTAIECRTTGTNTFDLYVEKQKDHEDGLTVPLRRVAVADSCVIHSHEGRGSSAPVIESEIVLLRAARESCGSDGLTDSQLRAVSGLRDTTYYRARKALLTRGALVKVGTSRAGRYTPAEEVADE